MGRTISMEEAYGAPADPVVGPAVMPKRGRIVSLEEAYGAPPPPSTMDKLKSWGKEAAGVGDLILGMPAFVAQVGATGVADLYHAFTGSEKPMEEANKSMAKIIDTPWMKFMLQPIATTTGISQEDQAGTTVGKALGGISGAIDNAAQYWAEKTGSTETGEALKQATQIAMVKGGETFVKGFRDWAKKKEILPPDTPAPGTAIAPREASIPAEGQLVEGELLLKESQKQPPRRGQPVGPVEDAVVKGETLNEPLAQGEAPPAGEPPIDFSTGSFGAAKPLAVAAGVGAAAWALQNQLDDEQLAALGVGGAAGVMKLKGLPEIKSGLSAIEKTDAIKARDTYLLTALKQGGPTREAAAAQIYRDNVPMLTRSLWTYTKKGMQVEDVVQRTMEKGLRMMENGQFRGDSAIETYLHRIASNAAKTGLRYDEARPQTESMDLTETPGAGKGDESLPSPHEQVADESLNGRTPEQVALNNALGEKMSGALAKVPENFRRPFEMRELEGLSYEEIAAELKQPIGTVRSQINRAKEALKNSLREYGPEATKATVVTEVGKAVDLPHPDIQKSTPENLAAQEESTNSTASQDPGGNQSGRITTRQAAALAAGVVGLSLGAQLDQENPLRGAVIGAVAGLGATMIRPSAIGGAIKSMFAADSRIRVNELVDRHEVAIGKAARAIWQQWGKVVEAAPNVADRATITNAIQNNRPLPPHLQAAAQMARDFFKSMGQAGQAAGVLNGLISDYVTNLWDLGGKNKAVWEQILNKAGGPTMSAASRFALNRRIANLELGKALGLVPLTEDVARIMDIYGNSLVRTIANKQLIAALKNQRGPQGEHLLIPSDRAPYSYVSMDNPALAGMRVHPDIAPSLKFVFDTKSPGAMMNGLSAVNTAIKRSAVSFSLFHAKALADALIGAMNSPLESAKILITSATGTNKYLKMLRDGGAGDLVDKAIEGGLKFTMERGKLVDEDLNGSFYQGMKWMQEKLDATLPGAGLPIKGLTKMNHVVDALMWERLHAGMKLSVFANKLEILQRNGVAPAEAGKMAASFANDIFGGLNWRRIAEGAQTKWGRDIALSALSPKGRNWLQLLLFAPDWTLSTVRAMTKAFGEGSGIKGLVKPTTVADLHRQYIIRSAIYYGIVGDAINYQMSGHHLWENKDPTMIDMGDGRTMQWSKHTMEPVHWLTKTGQQALNKLGFLPKETATQFMGVEYLSTKGAPPMDTSVLGRVKHLIKSLTPIAGQQAFGDSATPSSALAGALGAPIYGKTDAQKEEAKALIKELKAEKARNKKAEKANQ